MRKSTILCRNSIEVRRPNPRVSRLRKIAIIGTGISGLTAAYYLRKNFDLTLFEAGSNIGGHTHTVPVTTEEGRFEVDTGFIVFNDRTYPNFLRLIREINVDFQNADMSFSVKNPGSGLEYRGADLNGFFAQRSNLFRPRVYRILSGILKFNRISADFLENNQSENMSVGEFFETYRFSELFVENYFLPMGSAIWSCPHDQFTKFPIRFVMEFYRNHGLLSVDDRPQWHVISGGSSKYVDPLTNDFRDRIRLNSPVRQVLRIREGVEVVTDQSRTQFDHVILACHADQALTLLADQASPTELEILPAFPYSKNLVLLHTDGRIMPEQKRAWACWNYLTNSSEDEPATVTYYMNRLQTLSAKTPLLVSLNSRNLIDPDQVLGEFHYDHPLFGRDRIVYQQRQSELIDHRGCSYCGAYWGNGFHEDGVVSGIRVAKTLLAKAQCSTHLELAS